jgi:hypothetical protein
MDVPVSFMLCPTNLVARFHAATLPALNGMACPHDQSGIEDPESVTSPGGIVGKSLM